MRWRSRWCPVSNPVLNEDYILNLLSSPISKDTVHRLQDGAVQTLLDLYDRKVTREEFILNAGPCVLLYGQTAKYWALCTIYEQVLTDTITKDDYRNIILQLESNIKEQKFTVASVVERLKQCPLEKDPIN